MQVPRILVQRWAWGLLGGAVFGFLSTWVLGIWALQVGNWALGVPLIGQSAYYALQTSVLGSQMQNGIPNTGTFRSMVVGHLATWMAMSTLFWWWPDIGVTIAGILVGTLFAGMVAVTSLVGRPRGRYVFVAFLVGLVGFSVGGYIVVQLVADNWSVPFGSGEDQLEYFTRRGVEGVAYEGDDFTISKVRAILAGFVAATLGVTVASLATFMERHLRLSAESGGE